MLPNILEKKTKKIKPYQQVKLIIIDCAIGEVK